jgi:hypothetical protein
VARLAEAANVPMVPSADAGAAAEAINIGVHEFIFAEQARSTAGEFRAWFEKIESSSLKLLGLFGGLGAPDERDQARRNFIDRPVSCAETGFDSAGIDELLARIEQLGMTAAVMAAREKAKQVGNRAPGTTRLHIAHGMRLSWRILTGADKPGFGKPGEAAGQRRLSGPFISFTSEALPLAANRLNRGIAPADGIRMAAIEIVRKAGATPDAVGELYDIWMKAGGPARWAALMSEDSSRKK